MTDLSEPSVIVITGAMAAGKSTVAQLLAERLPRAAHVRGDVFRRMVVSGRHEMDPDAGEEALSQLRLRYRLSAATADEYAAAGFVAVVQDVILGPDFQEYVERVKTRPRYAVVLAPATATLAEREAARGKTGYGEWGPAELDRILKEDTPRIGLWLDTSALSPQQTVDEILRRLPEARLG